MNDNMTLFELIGIGYSVIMVLAALSAMIWYVIHQWPVDGKTGLAFWEFIRNRKEFEKWRDSQKTTQGKIIRALREEIATLNTKLRISYADYERAVEANKREKLNTRVDHKK